MIWKTAWKTWRKSAVMNGITVLQLAAAILAAAIMVSSIWLRYRKYLPFADWFGAQGILAGYSGAVGYGDWYSADYEHDLRIMRKSEDFDYLSAPVEVIGAHSISFIKEDSRTQSLQFHCLDDEIIRRYEPELQAGRWFGKQTADGEIDAVLSNPVDRLPVGSSFDVQCGMDFDQISKKFKVNIVGILADGASIPAMPSFSSDDDKMYTFHHFYREWHAEKEPFTQIIIPYSQFCAVDLGSVHSTEYNTAYGGGMVMLRYKEPVTAEQRADDRRILAENEIGGGAGYYDLEELDTKSKKWLYHEVYNLLPIIMMLLILVSVSAISTTALSTRRRLRDYAVYALSGMPWEKCILINLVQSLISAAMAGILAMIGGIVIAKTPLRETFYLHGTVWLIPVTAAILLLYLAVSLLMPFLMLRKNSVREVLRAN